MDNESPPTERRTRFEYVHRFGAIVRPERSCEAVDPLTRYRSVQVPIRTPLDPLGGSNRTSGSSQLKSALGRAVGSLKGPRRAMLKGPQRHRYDTREAGPFADYRSSLDYESPSLDLDGGLPSAPLWKGRHGVEPVVWHTGDTRDFTGRAVAGA